MLGPAAHAVLCVKRMPRNPAPTNTALQRTSHAAHAHCSRVSHAYRRRLQTLRRGGAGALEISLAKGSRLVPAERQSALRRLSLDDVWRPPRRARGRRRGYGHPRRRRPSRLPTGACREFLHWVADFLLCIGACLHRLGDRRGFPRLARPVRRRTRRCRGRHLCRQGKKPRQDRPVSTRHDVGSRIGRGLLSVRPVAGVGLLRQRP